MPLTIGSPVTALVDGILAALTADVTLMALVTSITGHVDGDARLPYPYIVLGHRTRQNDSGAMQIAGGHVSVQLDCWSDAKGPFTVQAILSRVAVLLERVNVAVTGYTLVQYSLSCDMEEIFDEPDSDTKLVASPEQRLYHGVQRWTAEIHG